MDRFQEMNVLLAVTDAASFAGGAKALGISAPSATRAIAALERRLGIVLLARNTRGLRVTEAGRRYVADCRRILLELEEAEGLAAGSALRARGHLTVTAPVMFGELYLIPLITTYLEAYPDVSVNAVLVDRLVNMADEGVDVALRIGPLAESNIAAIKAGEIRPVICAAPAFLDRVGRPAHPRDLEGQPTVMSSASTLLTQWRFESPEGPIVFTPQPRLLVSSNQAAIQAARLGWGYTRVLSYQVADAVARGELEIVLAAFAIGPLPLHLLYSNGKQVPAKVQTFVDHCTRHLLANTALQRLGAP